MAVTLHHGDCLEVLRGMPDNSVDSIVCDPPYGLSDHKPADVLECLKAWIAGEPYIPKGKGFMGQKWDAWVPGPGIWRECLRVVKPGGHLLAFAGTRSMDLMSMAVRLAGFELRDSIGYAHDGGGAPLLAWTFGSGFPKSMDVSKAIDKAAGVDREVIGTKSAGASSLQRVSRVQHGYRDNLTNCTPGEIDVTTPTTEAAKQWQGWGTALKPAWEPIILARKPLIGTVAANVLAHGTGGLNIDGCRVAGTVTTNPLVRNAGGYSGGLGGQGATGGSVVSDGRWPANLCHDGSPEVVALFPGEGDKSAARFFYCAKASKRDRDEGLDHLPEIHRVNGNKWTDQDYRVARGERPPSAESGPRRNVHPTVKPTDLMRYLCRLVTPPGGVVLDPFMGSGSTGKAAMLEGFRFIGIEREAEYVEIARARIAAARHNPA